MNLKPPGFAAAILRSFTVNAAIGVVDHGSGALPAGTGGSCGHGVPSPRPGWPLVGRLFFCRLSFAGSGHVFLAGGPDPSFYTRNVSWPDPKGSAEPPCAWEEPNREALREHFLASLAGDPPKEIRQFDQAYGLLSRGRTMFSTRETCALSSTANKTQLTNLGFETREVPGLAEC